MGPEDRLVGPEEAGLRIGCADWISHSSIFWKLGENKGQEGAAFGWVEVAPVGLAAVTVVVVLGPENEHRTRRAVVRELTRAAVR